ncbi:MAG: UDP-glucose--hexose-1-phosphate uridylyltransferase, partial [Candidatus Neomarinimicrobiota bacterium]
EVPEKEQRRAYDPDCYLCPGNERASGARNPEYASTYVFDNDFSALSLETPSRRSNIKDLLVAHGEPGICRVVCFSPRHDLTLAEMGVGDIRRVVDVWTEEYARLGSLESIGYVQIFENKGAMMGCSNPHPHGQIWAERSLPVEAEKEDWNLRAYADRMGSCLICDYVALEIENRERLVVTNKHFAALVPFWAVWPFETMVVSKRHLKDLSELSEDDKDAFADILKRLTTRYDNLFKTSFPYSAGIHQSPTDGDSHQESHFHMHFYPPLLKSATVKKFVVGYEMLANPQRDLLPETSAAALRDLSEVHYRQLGPVI